MPTSGILCTKRKPQKGVNNVKETLKEFIKKHRIDIIVIASLLLLSLLVLLIAQLTRKDGAVAIVTVNGETVEIHRNSDGTSYVYVNIVPDTSAVEIIGG